MPDYTIEELAAYIDGLTDEIRELKNVITDKFEELFKEINEIKQKIE